jgi:hydrogenase nickel incorporation protein HypA/HybF
MHETDMTKALILTVRDWWENQQPEQAIGGQGVILTVGKFTCVEPVGLQFAFEVQTQGTFLAGAELVIRETSLIAFCHTLPGVNIHPEIGTAVRLPYLSKPRWMTSARAGS